MTYALSRMALSKSGKEELLLMFRHAHPVVEQDFGFSKYEHSVG